MSVEITRPDATVDLGDTTLVGAASAHAALSDNIDSSYVEWDATDPNDPCIIGLDEPSASGTAKTLAIRARLSLDGAVPRVLSWTITLGSGESISGTTIVSWASPKTIRLGTLALDATPSAIEVSLFGVNTDDDFEIRAYELYADYTYVVTPTATITAPTGTLTQEDAPTVRWTHVLDSAGGPQTAFRVAIMADGQHPDTHTPIADSGVVESNATSWTPDDALDNAVYDVYVKVAQTVNGELLWSAWDGDTFTVNTLRPATPTLVATGDNANARNALALTVGDDSYRDYVLSLGPALYWMLDDDNGANDLSPNNRDGTGVGDITIGGSTNRPITEQSHSTDFDGSNDRLTSTYAPFVNGSTLTLTGWAWRDVSTATHVLIGGTGANGPYFFLASGSQTVSWDADNATAPAQITWAAAWPGNAQWVHWALVYNETTNAASLYINGTLVSTQTHTAAYHASAGNFGMGGLGSGSFIFDGKMAHTAVFTRALTAAEIDNLSTLPPSTSRFQIQRSDDGGTTWADVRAEDPDAIGVGTHYDYEAPNGTEVTYRARALHDFAGGTSHSDWVEDAAEWSSDDWWLKHPTNPDLNVAVVPRSQPTRRRVARQGTFKPLGRPDPINIADVREDWEGALVLRLDTTAEQDTLDALLDVPSPLLLQAPEDRSWSDIWLVIGDQERERVIDSDLFEYASDSLPWTQVSRPDGNLSD